MNRLEEIRKRVGGSSPPACGYDTDIVLLAYGIPDIRYLLDLVEEVRGVLGASTHEANDFNCGQNMSYDGCYGCDGDEKRSALLTKIQGGE